MIKSLSSWLKIYEDEIGLFAWMFVLFFLLRSSNIVFANYAETAFLKRFGVEYLPLVYMINSIATFVLMGLLAGVIGRLPGARLLCYCFVACGTSVAAIRFIIPLGIDLVYPLLFMLKAQYEALLGLLFWSLANDLYNTRQSKRLFPLITAGGVMGQVIGSFGTPFLGKAIMLDNLLLIYLVATLTGAVLVRRMEGAYPTLLLGDKTVTKTKSKKPLFEAIKEMVPLLRESTLVKILILLTLVPNIVIPIMNYQFNYAVNSQFATESGLIKFFSYFRGVLNMVSLVVLLFVGRIYGRWGLPVALMFHPFNYILAFLGFLFRFDFLAAMYARMSTMILRTTINNPARGVLIGLVPEAYRRVMRPFLRSTVVRIGLFFGSGLILLSENLFHPKYLSLVGIPFVAVWFFTIVFLKRQYSTILLDLIPKNLIALKALGEADIGSLFKDKKIQSQLVQGLLTARGDRCLWYARLMKQLAVKDLDFHIIKALHHQEDKTRIALLQLLSSNAGETAVPVFSKLATSENPELTASVIKAANRLDPVLSARFDYQAFVNHELPEVKAYALVGLQQLAPAAYRSTLEAWLESEDIDLKTAGVIAAGALGDSSFAAGLKEMLGALENEPVLPYLLQGLKKLGTGELQELAVPYLSHPTESIRLAALEAVEIDNDDVLKKIIFLMADMSENIHQTAKIKIETADYQNARLLVESLNLPQSRVRKGIFEILESLEIKDLDFFRFARSQVESGYQYLAEAERLREFPENPARNILIDHLSQKRLLQIENILRVLAVQDQSGQMNIIRRGIFSIDARQRANALEALDDTIDKALVRILMPLVEMSSTAESLAVGRRNFGLKNIDSEQNKFMNHLLTNEDWVTVALALGMLQDSGLEMVGREVIEEIATSENKHILQLVQRIIDQPPGHPGKSEDGMENDVTITDKILQLKGIEIFEGLSVSELAAVASVSEEIDYHANEIVIQEGSSGDTMYLIIKGEVSVIKNMGEQDEFQLDRIGGGDYFGEMALIEDLVRSASIRTEEPSRFLVLHKQEFKEIVREYPQIALEICKVLGGRIRKLHEKIKPHNVCD
jgi:hypothetical protein